MDQWIRGLVQEDNIETATSKVNEEVIEDKRKIPAHILSKEMGKYTGISLSSVRRMTDRKGMKQFKCLKTPRMSEGVKNQLQKD